jgi:hypothetical protein
MIRLSAVGSNQITAFFPLARQPPIDKTGHDAGGFRIPERLPAGDEQVIAIPFGVTVGRASTGAPRGILAATQQ